MLGLANVDSLVSTTGLEDQGMVNRMLLTVDGKPRGLLDMVSDRPLSARTLRRFRATPCWRSRRGSILSGASNPARRL